jgi:hypothetical protein
MDKGVGKYGKVRPAAAKTEIRVKTFLGAGLFFARTAELVATNFLGSIAQDIVERYDKMSIENLKEGLEVCLLMTDSKCNVPGPLQKEFGEKQLTLGQYILTKNQ